MNTVICPECGRELTIIGNQCPLCHAELSINKTNQGELFVTTPKSSALKTKQAARMIGCSIVVAFGLYKVIQAFR